MYVCLNAQSFQYVPWVLVKMRKSVFLLLVENVFHLINWH